MTEHRRLFLSADNSVKVSLCDSVFNALVVRGLHAQTETAQPKPIISCVQILLMRQSSFSLDFCRTTVQNSPYSAPQNFFLFHYSKTSIFSWNSVRCVLSYVQMDNLLFTLVQVMNNHLVSVNSIFTIIKSVIPKTRISRSNNILAGMRVTIVPSSPPNTLQIFL